MAMAETERDEITCCCQSCFEKRALRLEERQLFNEADAEFAVGIQLHLDAIKYLEWSREEFRRRVKWKGGNEESVIKETKETHPTNNACHPYAVHVPRHEERKPPVAVFEVPDPLVIPKYPKHLVYANGGDKSLEELRAERYWRSQTVAECVTPGGTPLAPSIHLNLLLNDRTSDSPPCKLSRVPYILPTPDKENVIPCVEFESSSSNESSGKEEKSDELSEKEDLVIEKPKEVNQDILIPYVDENEEEADISCNTRAFSIPLPASTPYQKKLLTSSEANTSVECQAASAQQNARPSTVSNSSPLSVILETSRERYSSSSGSSGAGSQPIQSRTYVVQPLEAVEEEELSRRTSELCISSSLHDPFDEALRARLLREVGYPGVRHMATQMNATVTLIKPPTSIMLGDEKWTVAKEIGRGAYAKVYQGFPTNRPNDMCCLKYEKPAANWEWYINREIDSRTQNDNRRKHFLLFRSAFIFQNGSICTSDWAPYGSLLNFSNSVKLSVQGSRCPMTVCIHLSIQILSAIECLHSHKIIHGDVKPDNFVLKEIGPSHMMVQLIDFGRAIDMSLLPPKTEFNVVVKTEDFTCVEMKENRPWTYQTDLYGVAGTIYTILSGVYMKTVKRRNQWILAAPLPRYMEKDMWDPIFNDLLNIPSCEELPDLHKIRKMLEIKQESYDRSTIRNNFSKVIKILKKR